MGGGSSKRLDTHEGIGVWRWPRAGQPGRERHVRRHRGRPGNAALTRSVWPGEGRPSRPSACTELYRRRGLVLTQLGLTRPWLAALRWRDSHPGQQVAEPE